jgi:hypothetical protein
MEINTRLLEEKWASIDPSNINGYRIKRISADSIPDIHIGLNHLADRCLVLELPRESDIVFFNRKRQNLSIFHLPDNDYIVIELLDPFFNDLFTDLIVSLYHRIHDFNEVEACARELVSSFNKWSTFFTAQSSQILSPDAVKGLWGELFILEGILSGSSQGQTDQLLDCWKGPWDNSHDFILPDKNIEVKTREASMVDVRISSEYQLEPEFEKPLELLILDVLPDMPSGRSIGDLIEDIREVVRQQLGDMEILFRALAQKGLNMRNLADYPQTFSPLAKTVYDCMAPNFPKITRSELEPAIRKVSYTLRTSALERFILNQTQY